VTTIEKGQIWRRKKTGKLVRITQAINLSSAGNEPYHDVHWETVDKPYRRGVSYEDYWVKNCELVEAEHDEDEEAKWAATVAPDVQDEAEESEKT